MREDFFRQELAELKERNSQSVEGKKQAESVEKKSIVLACMDERNTLTEEAFGLNPANVQRLATGGGMISVDDFLRIHQSLLGETGSGVKIYLSTHEVLGKPEFGCAAFKNDIEAQEDFFSKLKNDLVDRLPEAYIHTVSMDTSTSELRALSLDDRDEEFIKFVEQGGHTNDRWPDEGHGGYGIYVGEAYRAWVNQRNAYFHISATNPALAGNLDIALAVITGHSNVDLSDKPIILHIDEPTDWQSLPTGTQKNMEEAINAFLEIPQVKQLYETGEMKTVRTTTDLNSWEGQILQKTDK